MTKPYLRPKILDNGMALAANIDVWHKRLHVSPKKIRAIYDLGAVEGLSINNLPKHGPSASAEIASSHAHLGLQYQRSGNTNLWLISPFTLSRQTSKQSTPPP